jgi:hypothetical protein
MSNPDILLICGGIWDAGLHLFKQFRFLFRGEELLASYFPEVKPGGIVRQRYFSAADDP